MNENITHYARENFNLLLGERSAEDVKIKIGSAYPLDQALHTQMRGRDLVTGLPKEVTISDTQVREALMRSLRVVINSIKSVIEEIPPELISDILDKGIVLAGGGALLRGLDRLVHEATAMPIIVAEDPLTCVVRGTGVVVEDLETLKDVLLPSEFARILK